MLILGLQGSPRKKGNTQKFLSIFLEAAEELGANTISIDVPRKNISPCLACGNCERKGFCVIDDDMQEIYPLLRKADMVVMATPIFFYGPTAQMKTLIDRSQALWARRYTYKLADPGQRWRRGFMLSLGATKGKNLFEGISLEAKYFFDAVGATFAGSLTFKRIENPGDIEKHPTALSEAKGKAIELVKPYLDRKKVLFVCRENACRSQIASAFAQYYLGDRIEVESAGSAPAQDINPVMEEAMKEKGIDMAYREPKSTDDIKNFGAPDLIITMGCEDACPVFPGAKVEDWEFPDPAGQAIDFMRRIRDEIKERVVSIDV
ncbi:MAG: NAD(P)H-dependent oxidoreductase [Deltaproteobacteria bacterium]|nr:NAD(P)H-dependent oxidoreductase [Deltaproteobacteria bacterium]